MLRENAQFLSMRAGADGPVRCQNPQARCMYDAHGKLDKGGLVENYAPLVKRIAYQLMSRVTDRLFVV